MKKTLLKIEHYITQINTDQKVKENYRLLANRYFNECGCTVGGIFLCIALITSLLFTTYTESIPFFSLKNLGFIFLFAVLGKLIGIGLARLQLLILLNTVKNHKN